MPGSTSPCTAQVAIAASIGVAAGLEDPHAGFGRERMTGRDHPVLRDDGRPPAAARRLRIVSGASVRASRKTKTARATTDLRLIECTSIRVIRNPQYLRLREGHDRVGRRGIAHELCRTSLAGSRCLLSDEAGHWPVVRS